MRRARSFRRPFPLLAPSSSAAPPAPASWWLTGEIDPAACLAAYQAIGAASLADSYINLANPGTYDAAPVAAPSWSAAAGWIFAGASALNTGIQHSDTTRAWSIICRFSGVSNGGAAQWLAADGTSRYGGFGFVLTYNNVDVLKDGGRYSPAPNAAAVYCIAGGVPYVDGIEAGTIDTQVHSDALIYIGRTEGGSYPLTGNIQALAIYNAALSADQVAALTAAMQDLA